MTPSLTSSMTVLRIIAVAPLPSPSASMFGPSPCLKQQHHKNAHYRGRRVGLALARCLAAKPNGAPTCFPKHLSSPF